MNLAPRERLLDGAVSYVAKHGMADLSLRQLAAELGTSHRMLIHHFGSKEGLWVAIVGEVEAQQLRAFEDLEPDPADVEDAMWAWWRRLSDPSLWPNERLFFEVYSQGLAGRSPADQLLTTVVDSWVNAGAAMAVRMGIPEDEARASARLGLAVTRGLLLDLLATRDHKGVDDAMALYISSLIRRA